MESVKIFSVISQACCLDAQHYLNKDFIACCVFDSSEERSCISSNKSAIQVICLFNVFTFFKFILLLLILQLAL